MLVDPIVVSRFKRDLFDELTNKFRNLQTLIRTGRLRETAATNPRLLTSDRDGSLELSGIVRRNLSADAVFERRNNFAAGGVILWIRGKDEHHVQWQAHGITLNLNVAFLHDVEEPDLDFTGQIRQFVDSKYAAVGARE